jgi:hypothetical protein
MIAQYETFLGTNPVLELRSGTAPVSCESADTGTVLATISLPTDWMTAPSNGSISQQGSWSGVGGASGIAAHYRLKNSGGVCHEQGTVYQTGGTGDLELDNTNITSNQIVQVVTWTRTQGGQ